MFSGVKGGQDDKAERNRNRGFGFGLLSYLHSIVETEKAEPRRKLPGGQSSPQSLRGIASIVEPMGVGVYMYGKVILEDRDSL
jgi:hypothetical protein